MLVESKNKNFLFPMPVVVIATYNEDNSVDAMTAAWVTMEDYDCVLIELDASHKSSENIEKRGFFTLSYCDVEHVKECDYLGIVSYYDDKDKFKKSKFTTIKSQCVDAPIIEQLPITLECEVKRIDKTDNDFAIYAKIKSIKVKEELLDEKGHLLLDKCHLITYNSSDKSYREISSKIADGFKVGLELK